MVNLVDLMQEEVQWLETKHIDIKKSLTISHNGYHTEIEDVKSFIQFTKPTKIGLVDEVKSEAQVLFIKVDMEVYELMILESMMSSEVDGTLYKVNATINYNGEDVVIPLEYVGIMELTDHDNDVYLVIS